MKISIFKLSCGVQNLYYFVAKKPGKINLQIANLMSPFVAMMKPRHVNL